MILSVSGIPKLRRVLLAYSLHNPDIEYCQGFNRIAAIALLFLDEEEAFWCLLYILEFLLPDNYYMKQMIGTQVDQVWLTDIYSLVGSLQMAEMQFSLEIFYFFYISQEKSFCIF